LLTRSVQASREPPTTQSKATSSVLPSATAALQACSTSLLTEAGMHQTAVAAAPPAGAAGVGVVELKEAGTTATEK
jgi:hypothetical protein